MGYRNLYQVMKDNYTRFFKVEFMKRKQTGELAKKKKKKGRVFKYCELHENRRRRG